MQKEQVMRIDMLSAFAMYTAAVIGVLLGIYIGLSFLSSYRKNRYERKIKRMKKIDMEIQEDRKRAARRIGPNKKKRGLQAQKQSDAIPHNDIVEKTQVNTKKENKGRKPRMFKKWGTAKNHNNTVEEKQKLNIDAISSLFRKAASDLANESSQKQSPQKSHTEMQSPLRKKHEAANLLRQVAEENGEIGSDVAIDCEEQSKDVVETVRENMSAQEKAYKYIKKKKSLQ